MGVFDKVSLPLAFKGLNKFTGTPVTQITQDWFSLRPVFSCEMVGHSKITVRHSYYARLSPLQKPMMGTGRIVNRAFFVPYRCIMPAFDDMINDTDYTHNGQVTRYSHVPYVKQSQIVSALIDCGGATEVNPGDSLHYDFERPTNAAGTTFKYYLFTEKGRQIYAILTGLGLSVSPVVDSTQVSTDDALDVPVSVMKLLAYCRIVADWYVNNNFYSRANSILQAVMFIGNTVATPSTSTIVNNLSTLFNNVYYSTVDNDYFSTASVNPVVPTGSSSVVMSDVSNDRSGTTGNNRTMLRSLQSPSAQYPSTPVLNGTTDSSSTVPSTAAPASVSQYMIDALAALTSYMQRNNIVGHKALDRFKARFGVELSADKLDRSYYLGSNSAPLLIDEVMSNADTSGAALGAYVGRGETRNRDQVFKYNNDSNSHGVFMILSTLIPDIHYSQGITRDNLHINRLDFLTPEFDSLGWQAIARCELYNDAKTSLQKTAFAQFEPQKTFGLQPTYAEYCWFPDILAGDFRRINALDLRAFHLFRMFSEHNVEGSPSIADYKTISENFVTGNPSEFNKIFNYRGTDYDHFYCTHAFNVSLVQPKRRLVDSYEFHDDNEGREVSMPYRGTKLN